MAHATNGKELIGGVAGRPFREHMRYSYLELWRAAEQIGPCDWTFSVVEAASVTDPDGIHCHGDLRCCYCGDIDEIWQVGWWHSERERDQQSTALRPEDRDDYVPAHCNALSMFECMCVCKHCDYETYFQCNNICIRWSGNEEQISTKVVVPLLLLQQPLRNITLWRPVLTAFRATQCLCEPQCNFESPPGSCYILQKRGTGAAHLNFLQFHCCNKPTTAKNRLSWQATRFEINK